MPLLDSSLFEHARQLDHAQRWMSRWHRDVIKAHAPALAGIPSTSGLAAYLGVAGELRDLAGYAAFTGRRALRKLEQRVFRRGYRQESPDHKGLRAALRKTELASNALECLRNQGVLGRDIRLDDLPDVWLGRVVSLALIDEALRS